MNEKQRLALYSYIYNNEIVLSDDVRELQCSLRFRKASVNDCIELALAQERLETFRSICKDIRILLESYEK